MHSVSLQMVAVIGLSILFNVPRYLDDHVVRRPDGSLALERTYLGNNAVSTRLRRSPVLHRHLRPAGCRPDRHDLPSTPRPYSVTATRAPVQDRN